MKSMCSDIRSQCHPLSFLNTTSYNVLRVSLFEKYSMTGFLSLPKNSLELKSDLRPWPRGICLMIEKI